MVEIEREVGKCKDGSGISENHRESVSARLSIDQSINANRKCVNSPYEWLRELNRSRVKRYAYQEPPCPCLLQTHGAHRIGATGFVNGCSFIIVVVVVVHGDVVYFVLCND